MKIKIFKFVEKSPEYIKRTIEKFCICKDIKFVTQSEAFSPSTSGGVHYITYTIWY